MAAKIAFGYHCFGHFCRKEQMLNSLEIRDFALIERLRVDWTPGLNILTGETGAGKSILIDALNAVLGGKAGPSFIRAGAEKAYIEAEFAVKPAVSAWLKINQLMDEDATEVLTVCREITKSGSKVRINGVLVNHALAQELAQNLITIHAQHEARTLMSPQAQLDMLDGLGDQSHKKLLEQIRTLYARRKELQAQQRDLQISEEERLRRLSFARFQLNELDEAVLNSPTEDEELVQQQRVLANVSQLENSVSTAYGALTGDGDDGGEARCALDTIQEALSETERACRLDGSLSDTSDLLRTGLANVEEAARALRHYKGALDTDPETLAAVEARLTLLIGIKRKYGPTMLDAINLRTSLREEIERLNGAQTTIDEIGQELSKTESKLTDLSGQLSQKRVKLGERLAQAIEKELKELGMERCQFQIAFEQSAEINSSGCDRLEFVIAPNPGQPLLPLGKIASGGELSRVMLAVKSIFAQADEISTVIFDEIDTGLSGRVLQSMRDKLAKLARSHQILCITHQPIIASVADNHIHVRKEQHAQTTHVFAKHLSQDERLRSLAAMASGQEDAEVALNFARSLLDQANQLRSP